MTENKEKHNRSTLRHLTNVKMVPLSDKDCVWMVYTLSTNKKTSLSLSLSLSFCPLDLTSISNSTLHVVRRRNTVVQTVCCISDYITAGCGQAWYIVPHPTVHVILRYSIPWSAVVHSMWTEHSA